MQRFQINAIRDDLTVDPKYQTPAPNVQYWVRDLNGDIVNIYETNDTSGALKPNPGTTDPLGSLFFYAPNGRYKLEFATGDEWPDISMYDRNDDFKGNSGVDTNTSLGTDSLNNVSTGTNCTGIGFESGRSGANAARNSSVGSLSLNANTNGNDNSCIGYESLRFTNGGFRNSALGSGALRMNVNGSDNAGVGFDSLRLLQNGNNNQFLSNCSGLGNDSRVSGSNQVQLGNSLTTTYVYGTVQNRSDERDKEGIRDTVLGLDFINSLRPVDYKWNMREDYHELKNGEVVFNENDGSKTRSRYHHGLIAQEVQNIIKETGVDFGGFQDHSMSEGGCDVMSIGYDELIAPLIKAFQEYQSATNKEIEALKSEIAKLKA